MCTYVFARVCLFSVHYDTQKSTRNSWERIQRQRIRHSWNRAIPSIFSNVIEQNSTTRFIVVVLFVCALWMRSKRDNDSVHSTDSIETTARTTTRRTLTLFAMRTMPTSFYFVFAVFVSAFFFLRRLSFLLMSVLCRSIFTFLCIWATEKKHKHSHRQGARTYTNTEEESEKHTWTYIHGYKHRAILW